MTKKTALIIGAGPAGLTAAYELLDKTDIVPIICEASENIGGISRTVRYHGNRIDIGGHRFFSKSDRVMDWWLNIFPMQGAPSYDDRLLGRDIPLATEAKQCALGSKEVSTVPAPDPEVSDEVMLVRNRLSRILFLRKFFDYPISLSKNTITNLGFARMVRIASSYLKAQLFPIKDVKSLEDFYINQFGYELYCTFFRDYTAKVWGVPCKNIPPEWGAQRVKGLSLSKVILHALKGLSTRRAVTDQKDIETSLIESFIYPKYGPGELWESVAERIVQHGGTIKTATCVVGLRADGDRIVGVEVEDQVSKKREVLQADYVFSTMPVRDLIAALDAPVPENVRTVAQGLQYRDFMTVGVLTDRVKLKNTSTRKALNNNVPDNWVYIQEPDVHVGRLQFFNNWSPYMVKDSTKIWLGMEYFCQEGDDFWRQSDEEFSKFAVGELAAIGAIDPKDVLDTVVIRVQKAYPAYFGTYAQFSQVREYVDQFSNLFLLGRNGMHRYNNMDHSMLTAMAAVDNIQRGITTKDNVWQVNTEEEYHEAKGNS
ncbi:MAG TPA: NAD(P)/FAD-dependent oxidoreductase [Armatimonadota bacterium]|nr:NAD(P)/FAD-dependent oxidoreductase [Armatimonadota bacterium]